MVDEKPPRHPKDKLPGKNAPRSPCIGFPGEEGHRGVTYPEEAAQAKFSIEPLA